MLADEPTSTYMTTGQIAALFEVSRQTVHRWIKSGELPSIRLPGGTRKVRRADVEAVLAAPDASTNDAVAS